MAALAQVSWSARTADRVVNFLRLDPATYLARKVWAVAEKIFSWIGWFFGVDAGEPVARRPLGVRGRSLRLEQPVLYSDLKRMLQKPNEVIQKEWEDLQKICPPFVLRESDVQDREKNQVCFRLFGLDVSQALQLHQKGIHRFPNNLSSVATRVKISPEHYLNANWVLGQKYIAAQTPTPQGAAAFRQMLSDPELARARLIVFQHRGSDPVQNATYSYDASVTPLDPMGLAQFIRGVYNDKEDLLIVCCESGLGASGIFLAVYELYRKLNLGQVLKGDLDQSVFRTVEALREGRYGMVQTRGQYELIYNTLNILVDLC